MPRPLADPFGVRLSDARRGAFTRWLCQEILAAEAARPIALSEIEQWHGLYEQKRQRTGKQKPWADAADLTSYIPTEKVDALRARIVRTIFVDPIWTVEGYGDSAQKAPFVEEFHSWKAEEEGVQLYVSDAIHTALIETRGVLEVYEDTAERLTKRKQRVALELTSDGRPIVGADGQFKLQVGEDGKFVEVADDTTPSAEIVADTPERVRVGPAYRLIPYRDFLALPGHAKDKRDLWGYAKHFTRRLPELLRSAKAGIYDRDAVLDLGTDNEIAEATTLSGEGIPVATGSNESATAEKDLWEVLCLYDFDDKGERWYTATLSVNKQVLLRLRHDDLGARYVCLIPFRRPGRALEGYSLVGHKLISVTAEHEAWRNMNADRAALQNCAPIKRLETALWDPDLQPFGPKAVIDVRDMREVEPMVIPDLTAASNVRENEALQASERLTGLNDVALGVGPQESRTLGEVQMVTEQSFVRMEEAVRNIQEGLEDLAQIRHKIWQRVLAEQGTGMPMPDRVLLGLESRAVPIQEEESGRRFTADMLAGVFKFKPRGSVETADVSGQRQDFVQFLQVLPQLMQFWPALAGAIQGNTRAAKAILAQAIRLFRVSDKQAFLGSEAQASMQASADQLVQQQQQQAAAQATQMGQPAPQDATGAAPPAAGGGIPPELAAMLGGGNGGPQGPPTGAPGATQAGGPMA